MCNPSSVSNDLASLASTMGLTPPFEFGGDGWDYDTVIGFDEFGRRWIVRVARRPDVAPLLIKENAILNVLDRERIHLLIPNPEIHGMLKGLPAAGYQFIDAFPSTEEDIFNNAAGLARALVAIHSTPIEKFEEHLDTTTWKARTLEQLSVTESVVTWPERVLKQWKILLSMDELWSDPHVLCHGDLGPPHLLSREGTLVGIIDFSDLQFAPAAIDFGDLLTAFGAKVLNRVLMEYCAQSNANFDIVWAGAYAYQSLGPLFTAYHGITSNQSEFVESALRSLNENS